MAKVLIIRDADFAANAITQEVAPVMVACNGWIDSNCKSLRTNTGAFYGVVPISAGDSIYIYKGTGLKAFWFAQLTSYTQPTADGVQLNGISMTFRGTTSKRPASNIAGNPVTFTASSSAQYLAVSIFANDGDESTRGWNSPTSIKINGVSITIPTSL